MINLILLTVAHIGVSNCKDKQIKWTVSTTFLSMKWITHNTCELQMCTFAIWIKLVFGLIVQFIFQKSTQNHTNICNFPPDFIFHFGIFDDYLYRFDLIANCWDFCLLWPTVQTYLNFKSCFIVELWARYTYCGTTKFIACI